MTGQTPAAAPVRLAARDRPSPRRGRIANARIQVERVMAAGPGPASQT